MAWSTRKRGAVPTATAARDDWDDRGVAAVEAAIITPSSCSSSSGSSSSAWRSRTSSPITSAVRAGARIASAEPRIATFATDAAAQVAREGAAIDMTDVKALWVYKADSTGHPIGAGGRFGSCTTNCIEVHLERVEPFVSRRFVARDPQNACQGTQDSVGVYLPFNHPGVTKAFFGYARPGSYTVMRLEPIPTLQTGGCK